MPARVFAVLAATFLVAAVALGSILPAGEKLGEILASLDDATLPHLQAFAVRTFGDWAWQYGASPILARPIWFIPLALGIVCVGAVTTLYWLKTPSSPHRRRS